MTYLYATLFCMLAPILYLYSQQKSDGDSITIMDWRAPVGILCGTTFGIALILGLFPSASWKPNESVNITPLLDLAAGVVGVVFFSYLSIRMLRQHMDRLLPKFARGICIIATFASGYMIFAATDDLMFWQDKSATGIMSRVIFDKSDVKCDSEYIIVRKEGKAFRYRCPNNLVLGHVFGEPFLPWPSYQEGLSENLAQVHEEFTRSVQAEEQQRYDASDVKK